MKTLNGIPFPGFAKERDNNWRYVGWIENTVHPEWDKTYDVYLEAAVISRNGELREVDVYPEGAVCWVKKE